MNVLYFSQCKSLDDVEKTYEELYRMFGLRSHPVDHWLRRAIDDERQNISKAFESREKEKEGSPDELTMDQILEEIQELKLSGEKCGKWIWLSLSGRNFYKHRDHLRKLGFRFSRVKKSFYWRPSDCKSFNQEPASMDFIRKRYGSELIEVEA